MSDQLLSGIFATATAIVGVAIIAVLVSKNANTSGVLNSAGSAFAQDLGAALSPVTGQSNNLGSFTGLNGSL